LAAEGFSFLAKPLKADSCSDALELPGISLGLLLEDEVGLGTDARQYIAR